MTTKRQMTHHDGCWRDHHECAVRRVEQLTAPLARVGVSAMVRLDAYGIITEAVEEALRAYLVNRAWKHYIPPKDWDEHAERIAGGAADAVMIALAEKIDFEPSGWAVPCDEEAKP